MSPGRVITSRLEAETREVETWIQILRKRLTQSTFYWRNGHRLRGPLLGQTGLSLELTKKDTIKCHLKNQATVDLEKQTGVMLYE